MVDTDRPKNNNERLTAVWRNGGGEVLRMTVLW